MNNIRYDFDRIYDLSARLLSLLQIITLTDTQVKVECIKLMQESREYFQGEAAETFRTALREALKHFDDNDRDSVERLFKICEMPKQSAIDMCKHDEKVARNIEKILARKER